MYGVVFNALGTGDTLRGRESLDIEGRQRLNPQSMLALRVLLIEEKAVKQVTRGRGRARVQYSQIQVKKVFLGGESDKMKLVDQVRLF